MVGRRITTRLVRRRTQTYKGGDLYDKPSTLCSRTPQAKADFSLQCGRSAVIDDAKRVRRLLDRRHPHFKPQGRVRVIMRTEGLTWAIMSHFQTARRVAFSPQF